MRKLGHDHFSEFFKVNLEGSVGAKFPFHAHGDASLEMQMVGSSRYFFPNQDPVEVHAGDIVDCPKGKDGAHCVESLTEEQGALVANKEVVFDDMVIAIFDTEGMEKANYSETINGAILEDRIRAASAGSYC
ncbi:hypothetical protein WJX79_001060 [Trebouxia sp. C0005]|nr:MAG: hypothetical protein FRX49_01142 [Trebouxia sp. A1-2]